MSKMNSFIDYASDILGETDTGISTMEIISICNRFAAEYNVNIPHTKIYKGFSQTFSNKRTALKENLQRFNDQQAFEIIKHICEIIINICNNVILFYIHLQSKKAKES